MQLCRHRRTMNPGASYAPRFGRRTVTTTLTSLRPCLVSLGIVKKVTLETFPRLSAQPDPGPPDRLPHAVVGQPRQ
jgi:hypothetical protein